MRCKICGVELQKGTSYCETCGVHTDGESLSYSKREKLRKREKRVRPLSEKILLTVIIAVLSIVLMIVASILLVGNFILGIIERIF